MRTRTKVFFDGGCRPNPGMMELAVVAGERTHIARDIGQGTSRDAEWLALIAALRFAQSLALGHFVLTGDALAVIGVATGRVKCRGPAVRHLQMLSELMTGSTLPPIRYVKRSHNLAGIVLATLHDR